MCIILDVLSVCQELALILVAIFVRSIDLRMEGYKFLVDKIFYSMMHGVCVVVCANIINIVCHCYNLEPLGNCCA